MADELKPVYLLTGTDRPKVDLAVKRLRAHFNSDAVEHLSVLDSRDADRGADIVAACNSMGLFGDGDRLVLATEVDGRPNAEGRYGGGLKVADVELIAAYLASPAPGAVLALVAAELKVDSPLAKAVKKKGDVLVYDVSIKELPRWIRERFTARQVPADIEACKRLIELVGDDRRELATEVDRISTWSAGQPVTEDDIERVVFPRAETKSFALTDAFGKRDLGAALAAADAIFAQAGGDEREHGVNRELTSLTGILANHVRRLREVQELDAQGVRSADAAVTLKRHPFYVKKLYEQAANYSRDELRQTLLELSRLDHGLKGGSKEPGELSFVRTLVATVSRPEPTGRRT